VVWSSFMPLRCSARRPQRSSRTLSRLLLLGMLVLHLREDDALAVLPEEDAEVVLIGDHDLFDDTELHRRLHGASLGLHHRLLQGEIRGDLGVPLIGIELPDIEALVVVLIHCLPLLFTSVMS